MTLDYTFDEVAMLLSSLVVYLIGFVSLPLFFFSFVCVNMTWLHIIEPENKQKEYAAYASLCFFVLGFVFWSYK